MLESSWQVYPSRFLATCKIDHRYLSLLFNTWSSHISIHSSVAPCHVVFPHLAHTSFDMCWPLQVWICTGKLYTTNFLHIYCMYLPVRLHAIHPTAFPFSFIPSIYFLTSRSCLRLSDIRLSSRQSSPHERNEVRQTLPLAPDGRGASLCRALPGHQSLSALIPAHLTYPLHLCYPSSSFISFLFFFLLFLLLRSLHSLASTRSHPSSTPSSESLTSCPTFPSPSPSRRALPTTHTRRRRCGIRW